MIEHVATRDTLTVNVAYEPWLIGDVTLTRRTRADAAAGNASAPTSTHNKTNRFDIPTLRRVNTPTLLPTTERDKRSRLHRSRSNSRTQKGRITDGTGVHARPIAKRAY